MDQIHPRSPHAGLISELSLVEPLPGPQLLEATQSGCLKQNSDELVFLEKLSLSKPW